MNLFSKKLNPTRNQRIGDKIIIDYIYIYVSMYTNKKIVTTIIL